MATFLIGDPLVHKFQCSKHQDKHPWFCFEVVDLMYRYFPFGWSRS